jgi:hypothetical protein
MAKLRAGRKCALRSGNEPRATPGPEERRGFTVPRPFLCAVQYRTGMAVIRDAGALAS